MAAPKLRSEKPDSPKIRTGKAGKGGISSGDRIIAALDGRTRAWLAEKTGLSTSSISDYVEKGIAKADAAVAIARALEVSVDWLLTGAEPNISRGKLISAENAEWIAIPEYDLRFLDDAGKGEPVSETKIRRDWLYGAIGETQNLWLTRLLAGYLDLPPGSAVFCRDPSDGEAPIDGAHYLFRVNGGIVVARFSYRSAAQSGDGARVTPADLGHDDGQHVIIARLLGALARPL